MPTIGWFEILIVVAIAIVVLGPAKKYINNIQNEVSNIEVDDKQIEKKEKNKDES